MQLRLHILTVHPILARYCSVSIHLDILETRFQTKYLHAVWIYRQSADKIKIMKKKIQIKAEKRKSICSASSGLYFSMKLCLFLILNFKERRKNNT